MADKHTRYNRSEKGRQKHKEYMRDYMPAWRARRKAVEGYDQEEERRKWREQHQIVRRRAMEKLGGLNCCNCGCDQFPLLEINHLRGGGRQAMKATQNRKLYRLIANDKIDLDEYNVLCRVCNAMHYVQEILGIQGHTVIWRGSLIG